MDWEDGKDEGVGHNEAGDTVVDKPDFSSGPSTKTTNIKRQPSKKSFQKWWHFNDLVVEIHEYVGAYKHVATYFQNESKNNTRKIEIFEELVQLLRFSTKEIMNAGKHILKDGHKLDTFFALPKELSSH